jgi:hypothetical protein
MVRRRFRAVSNHEMPHAPILRDAAKRPLLRMRKSHFYATTGFGIREIASVIKAATIHNAPAMKNAGR